MEFTFHHCMNGNSDSSLEWWHHVSSPVVMLSRKMNPSASFWLSRSWQLCVQSSFYSCEYSRHPPSTNCHISILTPSFRVLLSWYSAPSVVSWMLSADLHGWPDQMHFFSWCDSCASPPRMWWLSMSTIFSTWRNSMTQLSSIHTSMSDITYSDCPTAAFCHTSTKSNRTGRKSISTP